MTFNDTSSQQGLAQDTRALLGFGVNDTSTLSNADICRSANVWYRRAVNFIWQTVGDWEYDDTNLSTLPIATTDLVDGQADYELPSGAQAIERVEVQDADGNWALLSAISKEQVKEAMTEQFETEGMPQYYDAVGRSVVLYPSPLESEVTASGGLKLYVSRDIDEFTSTNTTKEPGFANNFHRIISLGVAYDFANAKGMTDKLQTFREQIERIKEEIQEFYARRHERGFPLKIKPSTENFV